MTLMTLTLTLRAMLAYQVLEKTPGCKEDEIASLLLSPQVAPCWCSEA